MANMSFLWIPDSTLSAQNAGGAVSVAVLQGAASYTAGVWTGTDGITVESGDVFNISTHATAGLGAGTGAVAIKFRLDSNPSAYQALFSTGHGGTGTGQYAVLHVRPDRNLELAWRRDSTWSVLTTAYAVATSTDYIAYIEWDGANIGARLDDAALDTDTRAYTAGDAWRTGGGAVKFGSDNNAVYEKYLLGRIDAVAHFDAPLTSGEYDTLRTASSPWTWDGHVAPANTAPTVDAGADATITAGDTLTRTVSFTDPDADTWSATADYGEGAGAVAATVDQGAKTVALSNVYETAGNYTVTVVVNDGTTTGQDTFAVTVDPAPASDPPVVDAGAATGSAETGTAWTRSGSFTDADSAGPWTATVDYGEGAGPQALTLDGMTFDLSHTYSAAGEYTVTVAVTDEDSSEGTDSVTVTVTAAPTTGSYIAGTVTGTDTSAPTVTFTS